MPKNTIQEAEAYAQALQEQTMTYLQLVNVLDAVAQQITKNATNVYSNTAYPTSKARNVEQLVRHIVRAFEDNKRPRGGEADVVREKALDLALLIRALRREEETLASRHSDSSTFTA